VRVLTWWSHWARACGVRGAGLRRAGVVLSTPDGQVFCADFARFPQEREGFVGGFFCEGAEGRPFATHEVVDREADGVIRLDDAQAVFPRDQPDKLDITGRQRTYPTEVKDDLRAIHLHTREDMVGKLHEIVYLFISANGVIRLVTAQVGGADDDFIAERHEDRQAAIGIFEENTGAVDYFRQRGVIDDDVRAFGATDEASRFLERPIDEVDPGTTGIDDQPRLDGKAEAGR